MNRRYVSAAIGFFAFYALTLIYSMCFVLGSSTMELTPHYVWIVFLDAFPAFSFFGAVIGAIAGIPIGLAVDKARHGRGGFGGEAKEDREAAAAAGAEQAVTGLWRVLALGVSFAGAILLLKPLSELGLWLEWGPLMPWAMMHATAFLIVPLLTTAIYWGLNTVVRLGRRVAG